MPSAVNLTSQRHDGLIPNRDAPKIAGRLKLFRKKGPYGRQFAAIE